LKVEIEKYPLIHPATIVLIGTSHENVINFTTIGDIAIAGINPPLIMISINENHLASTHIDETSTFSINVPTTNLLEFVDYCGIYTGKVEDKSKNTQFEIVDNVPIITLSPISLIAKVLSRQQISQRVIYLCEIIKTLVDESIYKNQTLNLSEVKTILYGLDNQYYELGKAIGIGYKIGIKKI